MFETLLGSEMPLAVRFFIAIVVVLLIILLVALLVRAFAASLAAIEKNIARLEKMQEQSSSVSAVSEALK
jgi:hypothetical protein